MALTRYLSDRSISASYAYVGLAPPGDVGSWQRECKVILIHHISKHGFLHIINKNISIFYYFIKKENANSTMNVIIKYLQNWHAN